MIWMGEKVGGELVIVPYESMLEILVNGVEVYSTTSAPSEEMYIGLSSNVVGEGNIGNADLQVEWIKVYQLAQ